MRLPRFTDTLHFRLSALFLVLLAISGVGFWKWIDATILTADMAAEEEAWYDYEAETEMHSLAVALGEKADLRTGFADVLEPYTPRVKRFDAELIIFDNEGNQLASSHPESLLLAIPRTDSELLEAMSEDEWDFSSYPLADNIDAYENRIFHVAAVHENGDPEAPRIGFLAASFRPIIIGVEELDSDTRKIGFQALTLALVYAALSGLIVLGWLTRRLRSLTAGVAEFAAGNLSYRVASGSRDEIGALGRGFNHMADRVEHNLEQVQRNERFQRQLIANISHDLRTPLSSLRGYIETLSIQAGRMTESERNKYLDIITGNLDHLDRLIERTLILSRFDSGQTRFQMEDFPLVELADSVLLRSGPAADAAAVTLELHAPEHPVLVHADALQIAQVLQNLIENAIKFNHPGGRVDVHLEAAGGEVEIRVKDTGVGIPAEDLPLIFDRFYTGSESRTRGAGTVARSEGELRGQSVGLGLAIAAKIVDGHERRLEVSSEPGAGTEFRFRLPAAGVADPLPGTDHGQA